MDIEKCNRCKELSEKDYEDKICPLCGSKYKTPIKKSEGWNGDI